MRHFIGAVIVLTSLAFSADARPLSQAEHSSLDTAIELFEKNLKQGNMEGISNAIPARIVNHISRQASMEPAKFRSIVTEQLIKAMAGIAIQSVQIDVSQLDVMDARNADGTETIYAVTSYSFSMLIEGKINADTSSLIAVSENGKWGLIRIAPNQIDMLIELYPFFTKEMLLP